MLLVSGDAGDSGDWSMELWRQEGDPGDGVRGHWGGTGAVKMGWHLPLTECLFCARCKSKDLPHLMITPILQQKCLYKLHFIDRKPEACGGDNGLKQGGP